MRIQYLLALLLITYAGASIAKAQSFDLLGYLGPGGGSPSIATDLSADGTVVVGTSRRPDFYGTKTFRWTAMNGMEDPNLAADTYFISPKISGDSSKILWGPYQNEMYLWTPAGREKINNWQPKNLSHDGSVLAGSFTDANFQTQARRWSPATGFTDLGFLVEGNASVSAALDVSADGNVIVGYSKRSDGDAPVAFRWTQQSGMTDLGFFALMFDAQAINVSADGKTIVGVTFDFELVRWTEAGGTQSLGFKGQPTGISGDGSRIVGVATGGNEPFIWDAYNGVQNLQDVLANDYGLAPSMAGWVLTHATISDDGRTLVGQATSFSGFQNQAWVATIPALSIPEPSTFALAVFGSAWLTKRRRNTRAKVRPKPATFGQRRVLESRR